jgi:hypothetical protein
MFYAPLLTVRTLRDQTPIEVSTSNLVFRGWFFDLLASKRGRRSRAQEDLAFFEARQMSHRSDKLQPCDPENSLHRHG